MIDAVRRFLFGRQSGPEDRTVAGDGRFRLAVVGESHYQKALLRICKGRPAGEIDYKTHAILIADRKNRVDGNAVRVEIQGRKVGYLRRQDAFLFAERIRVGDLPAGSIRCAAVVLGCPLSGRSTARSISVRLDVELRPREDGYPCPYCRKRIEPTPTENQPCPHCRGEIVVRRDQPLTVDSSLEFDRFTTSGH